MSRALNGTRPNEKGHSGHGMRLHDGMSCYTGDVSRRVVIGRVCFLFVLVGARLARAGDLPGLVPRSACALSDGLRETRSADLLRSLYNLRNQFLVGSYDPLAVA